MKPKCDHCRGLILDQAIRVTKQITLVFCSWLCAKEAIESFTRIAAVMRPHARQN